MDATAFGDTTKAYFFLPCQNTKPTGFHQVVGAGVAGLVCARTLRRRGVAVEVFEASPDGVGGRVRSDRVPLPGGRLKGQEFQSTKIWFIVMEKQMMAKID